MIFGIDVLGAERDDGSETDHRPAVGIRFGNVPIATLRRALEDVARLQLPKNGSIIELLMGLS